MADENTRHREQVRNNRQENFGDRLAAAINHLSGTTAVEQVAGLTELAGIAEDWWHLGQEMKNDLPDTEEQRTQQQQIDDMVNRRRQEIIDLMFKTPLATLEQDSYEEQQRDKQVQQRRSSILRKNISNTGILQEVGSPPEPQLDSPSWARLNFENADLRGKDLRHINLHNANLRGADLSDANLQHTDLHCAELSDATLGTALFFSTDLKDATLDDNYTGYPYYDEHTEARSERNDLSTYGFTKVTSNEEQWKLLEQW